MRMQKLVLKDSFEEIRYHQTLFIIYIYLLILRNFPFSHLGLLFQDDAVRKTRIQKR